MLLRDFQPLTAPDALNPVLAHIDPGVVKEGRHSTIAVAAILGREIDNVLGQLIFIGLARGNVSLRSPWLPDDPAGLSLAQTVPLLSCRDRLPAPLGAYNFP